jgi:hypothetical protein
MSTNCPPCGPIEARHFLPSKFVHSGDLNEHANHQRKQGMQVPILSGQAALSVDEQRQSSLKEVAIFDEFTWKINANLTNCQHRFVQIHANEKSPWVSYTTGLKWAGQTLFC